MRALVVATCIVGVQLASAPGLAGVSSYSEKTGTVYGKPPVTRGRTVSRRPKSTQQKRKASGLKMRQKLKERVDISFADMDVAEAIQALGQMTKANIVMDARAFAEIERKGFPKVNLRLKDVPLEAALSAIVRSAGLNYTVHDHFVFISTPYRGRNQAINGTATRTYRMNSGANSSLPKIGVRNPGGPR